MPKRPKPESPAERHTCSECGATVYDPFEHFDGCPKPTAKRPGVHLKALGAPWCGAPEGEPCTTTPNDATCPACEKEAGRMWRELIKPRRANDNEDTNAEAKD